MDTIDGNTAACHIAYACSEQCFIFPITPSSAMSEMADALSVAKQQNVFGSIPEVTQMQSEGGVAGAIHGAAMTGAAVATFSASQGVLLMIPNMYKLAGECLPAVFHLASRQLSNQVTSIYSDHSDVMSCRASGIAILSSHSVQEAMDMALVAHIASMRGRVPIIHFFDGFQVSHEIQKIEMITKEMIAQVYPFDALEQHRQRALNPIKPTTRSFLLPRDVYMQANESLGAVYGNMRDVVRDAMDRLHSVTGRRYDLFDYHGDADAETVIVLMGAGAQTVREVLQKQPGQKRGVVCVHLYRPWFGEEFMKKLPATTRHIAVLDRVKEYGSEGEPLLLDVATTVLRSGRQITVVGGRHALGDKLFSPGMVNAVFENARGAKKDKFTIGINDDVMHSSLAYEEINLGFEGKECIFWGLGSDGTVGANKNSIKIIGENTPLYAQGYFFFNALKSGGLTFSHLRFGKDPVIKSYPIQTADFIGCHQQRYLGQYPIIDQIKENGTLLINTNWSEEELERRIPEYAKRILAERKVKVHYIDAQKIAREAGLGHHINVIMQVAFFYLSEVMDFCKVVQVLKDTIQKTYGKKGEEVVRKNQSVIDKATSELRQMTVKEAWKNTTETVFPLRIPADWPKDVGDIKYKMNIMQGDDVPVSRFVPGMTSDLGSAQYDKRGIATVVPEWNAAKCVECNLCTNVCSHAVIRPFLLTKEEKAQLGVEAKPSKVQKEFEFRVQVSPLDCTSCGVCASMCPTKALTMVPCDENMFESEHARWKKLLDMHKRARGIPKTDVQKLGYHQPLYEFSGACGGCGESPYMVMLSRLFGERVIIANASGCSIAVALNYLQSPMAVSDRGFGMSMANSLFEDNAEFGLGMAKTHIMLRRQLKELVEKFVAEEAQHELAPKLQAWLGDFGNADKSADHAQVIVPLLDVLAPQNELQRKIKDLRLHLMQYSIWLIGGDGWANDIDFGGIDHVLSLGVKVNILVLDTEVYSNTGGQKSKATSIGAVHKFEAGGKRTFKKDLAMYIMNMRNVYLGQCAMHSNPQQALKCFKEAEEFDGVSVVIGYCPCIEHGIVGDWVGQVKKAVTTGYWPLMRYNPNLRKEGKSPFVLDSKVSEDIEQFISKENRFVRLTRENNTVAVDLHEKLRQNIKERFEKFEEMKVAK